jgi:GT2 family glycosyltransferase
MAVWDTEENGRTEYTRRTLSSLYQTVDNAFHRIIVVDNASCEETKAVLNHHVHLGLINKLITLDENVGTAKAINKAWQLRKPNEHCIKMDNDVVIHQDGWADDMEKAITLDPNIGIVGLKRKDCWENPNRTDFYKSEMHLLGGGSHRWLPIEKVNHVMGTCQMFNSALLDKIGYLYQPRLYGFDDSLAAVRCQVAGFYSCFLPHIEIDHIDTGETPYQKWKENHAGEDMRIFNELKNAYINGTKPIYSEATW